jgi:predicted dehydrogenase
MLMIRAAIVGLGWWGQTLVNAVQTKSEKIQIVAAHTRTPTKASDFCRERGIQLHDDLSDLLVDPRIDAIVFATPHSEHTIQVERAAAAGKHIFMEKPLALDVAGARNAVLAAQRAAVVLGVGFQRRFNPSHLEIKARMNQGLLGTLVHCAAEAMVSGALFMPNDTWRSDPRETPGGAMTPVGIHVLDGMIDLFGEIEEVFCLNLRRGGGPVDDTTSVLLSLRNGASANLISSLATARNSRMVVYGTKGFVEATKTTSETLRFVPVVPPSLPPGATTPKPEVMEFPSTDTERASLEAFADAIVSGTLFPIPAEELIHGVAAFAAIVRSANSGQPVKLASLY